MGALEWLTLAGLMLVIVGLFGGVISYFLSQKDASQQRDIDELRKALTTETADRKAVDIRLFDEHKEDASKLQEFKEKMANQPTRQELDKKFDDLGEKFDTLNTTILAYMHAVNNKGVQ